MGFQDAVTTAFQKYFDFQGRAVRSEYWYFTLFVFIVSIVASLADFVIFGPDKVGAFGLIGWLATVIPSLSVSFRRMHDTGRSAWFLLLFLIPVIGWILLIYWYCQPGEPQPNAYGPNPMTGLQAA